jgi:hypothetical protein
MSEVPPHPLQEPLETLLQEREAEVLAAWAAAADPALRELLEHASRRLGTAAPLWQALGLPHDWDTPEDAAGAWSAVLAASRAFREPRFQALIPLLGPQVGALPEEILFEAYPKALAASLHGEDLPLPAWQELLQALQAAHVLRPAGAPSLWTLSRPAECLARQALRESEPPLRESVWRVYANVCGDYAQIALERLRNPGAPEPLGAIQRLIHIREPLESAFDYLIARHRPSRAKPLLDLLRLLDLEAGPARSGHAQRLYAWTLCHPLGEFCPPEQRSDLALALLELAPLLPELQSTSTQVEDNVTRTLLNLDTTEAHLAAELTEALAKVNIADDALWRRAARLYLATAQHRKAARLTLRAFLSGTGEPASALDEARQDALWDLAEITLDGAEDPFVGLECTACLLAAGEDAHELWERALSQAEQRPFDLEEFSRLTAFLLRYLQPLDGGRLVLGSLERLTRAVLRRHPADPEPSLHAAHILGRFPHFAAESSPALAALSLRLLAALPPLPDQPARYSCGGAVSHALRLTQPVPDGPPTPEYLLLLENSHRLFNQVYPGLAPVIEKPPPFHASDQLRRGFRETAHPFWDCVAVLEHHALLSTSIARALADAIGWELAPFRGRLHSRAEHLREDFLQA